MTAPSANLPLSSELQQHTDLLLMENHRLVTKL